MSLPESTDPPRRILVEAVEPQVDCGRSPAKSIVGDRVEVGATIVRDGHEVLGAAVRFKAPGATRWRESRLEPVGNDRFAGGFEVDAPGRWCYRIEAWVDRVASYRREVQRKHDAGQADLASELAEGALLLGRDSLTHEHGDEGSPCEIGVKNCSHTEDDDDLRDLKTFV